MILSTKKSPYYTVISICIALIFLTSSFDIVANIDLFGFNLRACQFLSLILIALLIAEWSKRPVRVPIGGKYLIAWMVIQFLFIFRSLNFANAFGYFMWLVFDVFLIFAMVQYVGRAFSLKWLLRVYFKSFVWIAVLGLVQFVLFALGIDFFVAQHWTDRFARINGFCYEPSFYSTYLLPGFVIFAYLFEKKNSDILSLKEIKIGLLIISAALILSTSRMGWLMMGLWMAIRIIVYLVQFIRSGISRKNIKIFIALVLIMLLLIVGFLYIAKNKNLIFLLNGLGIAGTSRHSSMDRINGLTTCLQIFRESPLVGVSLGGVDAQIAKYTGVVYTAGKNGSAMSIIGELLVANGIVGLIPFVLYIIKIIFGGSKNKSIYNCQIIKALRWALIFELGILCFNQNILRPYVWMLIAVFSAGHCKCNNRNWI